MAIIIRPGVMYQGGLTFKKGSSVSNFHAYHNLDKQGQFGGIDFYTSFGTVAGDSLYVVLGKKNRLTGKSDFYFAGKYVVKSVQSNISTGELAKKKWHLEIKSVSNLRKPFLFSNLPVFNRKKYLDNVISTGGFKKESDAISDLFKIFDEIVKGAGSIVEDEDSLDASGLEGNEKASLNKVMRSILERRGQPKFRTDLLNVYSNRCCITGCAVMELLEAAHINPYSEEGDNSLSNGLILRADIHTLFDRNLLTVDEHFFVIISRDLIGSEYESLKGKKVHRNAVALPSEFSLKRRYELFLERENSLR